MSGISEGLVSEAKSELEAVIVADRDGIIRQWK